ncbi:hypothetical protein [Salipiger mucosus]|uniref:Cation/multidrug efflux pump n=1 Tax=Salipiger mucosus DSM 16094 TaxID=1123237 RepID=S9QND8_9RHOB|nr:hypothetical protein [Salipiger mucosus]EPX82971.1 Cation/multidrug efflux pump [Salipiger mucosus DSM 16094]
MYALARFLLIGFAVLTVIYLALSAWSRSVRRRKLQARWDARGGPGTRADYVARGLRAYDRSLRRKLILGVYIVPACVVALIVYLTNFH